MRKLIAVLAMIVPLLGGCVAKTAYNVATLPVKAGGKVIDWTTTSQKEADRKAGRRMRLEQERQKRAQRAWEKRCRKTPDVPSCQPATYRAAPPALIRPRICAA